MNEGQRYDYRDRITDEAADWFCRLQDCEINSAERAAFAYWLSASPEHVREYLSLTMLRAELGELPGDRSIDELVKLAGATDGVNVVPFDSMASFQGRAVVSAEPMVRSKLSIAPLAAIAASIVMVVGAAVAWFAAGPTTTKFTTGIGEQKSFPLPDGSLITLNAVSKLQIRFTQQYRDIQLLSGEAMFDVEKDPRRPFRVLTRDSIIKAIGTRFNVYHRHSDTAVTVVDGVVEVEKIGLDAAAKPSEKMVRITQGQRAHVIPQRGTIDVQTVDPAVETGWRERRLIFESRRLSDVVAEFNLYNDTPIQLPHPALGAIEISGSFYANDPHSFAQFLEEAKLAKSTISDKAIVLSEVK